MRLTRRASARQPWFWPMQPAQLPLATEQGDGEPSAFACPGCGHSVDPLRAGHVAILQGRFLYFCAQDCKRDYLDAQGTPRLEDVATASPPEVAAVNGSRHAAHANILDGGLPPSPSSAELRSPSQPVAIPDAVPTVAETDLSGNVPGWRAWLTLSRALAALDAVGMACGALAPAIGLLGGAADMARLPLVLVALGALATRVARAGRDPADPHSSVVLGPATGAVLAACWARAVDDPRAVAIASLAGLSCAGALAVEILAARACSRTRAARQRIARELDVRVRAIHGDETVDLPASEVRPGEQIVVAAGESVGVDATVLAGEANVVPWLGANVEVVRREGDPVLAGARVTTNRLRLTTTWSGPERAWVKLLSIPSARIDVAAPTARALRLTVERGSLAAAALVGVGAFAANATSVEILAAMSAGAMAFGAKALCSVVGLHFARAHLEALANGITYKDARAFERAASANVAVLSARGTVLLGEPEIVAIEPVRAPARLVDRPEVDGGAVAPSSGRGRDSDASGASGASDFERVLSLAAGAETASTHPFAAAILRAARTHAVRADHVRNATVHDGLGVTALASTGERLVVGGRAIMLEEKIGVAVADARVKELEAQGRSVLLVALGDRLVGLIALQDGLRPGARAAVQRLLDARIEPVLLSGEARDTCETIGRALDIEHIRPEVLPSDRGAEVRALAEGGSVVAVLGHPQGDDGALAAADVAVAMGAAGSTPGEWAVALAGDDVRDAALALGIPHATRARVRAAIAVGATPALVALMTIGFGIAPLAVAPLAALLSAAAVVAHAREAGGRAAAASGSAS